MGLKKNQVAKLTAFTQKSMIGATFRDFSPGLVVDAPADDADLVVDLRVVVGLGVDAAVVAFELVGHLQTAAW